MLADFCKHRFLLSLSPVIPTQCGGVPLGVPPDLKSGVKKRPNLFRLCGFAIRSKGVCFSFYWGITNPQVFIGRTFFTADLKSAGTPGGFNRGISPQLFPYSSLIIQSQMVR